MSNSSHQPERYAIYARVAADSATPDGIAAQVRVCQAAATKLNPQLSLAENGIFTDIGTSGTNEERPGLKALIESAKQQPQAYTHVFVSDASHLGRNLREVLPTIDLFTFHGVTIHFAKLWISSADRNFRDLMFFSEFWERKYFDDLGLKVRHGLRNKAARGYSTGGRCFGYASTGESLSIATAEAQTVRRIYKQFSDGISVPQIVKALNAEHVPGPRAAKWNSRNVYALLRRPLYRGTLVWGTTRTVRHPETGKLMRCRRPESETLRVNAPHLTIVRAHIASAVDQRLASLSSSGVSEAES